MTTEPAGPAGSAGPTREPAPKSDTTTRSWLRDHSELG
ncbi:tripartite tricarboxylate transporter TctB family protein, partial [Streptomyces sp. SID8455]|nr:tripartite tricarboxylate transporter TctB family protein [Streptomyces sp. SID8455]